jgi:hypothetical protein
MFSGAYPIEYFAKDKFKKLEYINANFNEEVVVPEFCIRYAFCFKSKYYNINFIEMLNEGRFGNHYTYVAKEHLKMLNVTASNFTANEIDY